MNACLHHGLRKGRGRCYTVTICFEQQSGGIKKWRIARDDQNIRLSIQTHVAAQACTVSPSGWLRSLAAHLRAVGEWPQYTRLYEKPVPATALDAVHRLVCEGNKHSVKPNDSAPLARPDTHRDSKREPVDANWRIKGLNNLGERAHGSLGTRKPPQHNSELVTTQARNCVFRAHVTMQTVRDLLQYGVPRIVAE